VATVPERAVRVCPWAAGGTESEGVMLPRREGREVAAGVSVDSVATRKLVAARCPWMGTRMRFYGNPVS